MRIGGVQALKITGIPVTVKLPPNEAKALHEKWAQARWTLSVNPKTYLPVRMTGSTRTFGGTGGSTLYRAVTNAYRLSADRANIAKNAGHHPARLHAGDLTGQPVAAVTDQRLRHYLRVSRLTGQVLHLGLGLLRPLPAPVQGASSARRRVRVDRRGGP